MEFGKLAKTPQAKQELVCISSPEARGSSKDALAVATVIGSEPCLPIELTNHRQILIYSHGVKVRHRTICQGRNK